MSYSHLLTKPSTSALLPTLTTTSTSPQPRPTPIPTLAALPLQTPDSKWRIQLADCKPTFHFPPLEPSPRPLLHAAAIQIPGSQWRLALKTKSHLSPSPTSDSTSTPPNTPQSPPGPRLGKARRMLQSSQSPQTSYSDASQASSNFQINDDKQTDPPEKKRTYLDALKYENAIRMQLALKPSCRKLERKMGYLRRWKERWAKFDGLRRVLGCVVEDERKHDRWIEGEAETEGAMPTSNEEQRINRSYYGDWRRILWPSLRDLSLASDENHKTPTGSGVSNVERRRGGRRWLDGLEREWWGDGFPMLAEGGDRGEGWECWLDEVD